MQTIRYLIILLIGWQPLVHAAETYTVEPNEPNYLPNVPLNTDQEFTVLWEKDTEPQANQQIKIAVTTTLKGVVISTKTSPLETDAEGKTTFTVRSSVAGKATLTVSTTQTDGPKQDVAVTFVEAKQTLTYSKVGSGTLSPPTPAGTKCGTRCEQYVQGIEVTFNATEKSEQTPFLGWEGNCTAQASDPMTATVTMDTDKNCTAKFGWLLTVNVSGNGNVSSEDSGVKSCTGQCTKAYLADTAVKLTATAVAGAVFTGWEGGCQVTNPETPQIATVTMSALQTCTAKFDPLLELKITKKGDSTGTVVSQPAGIECGTTCAFQYGEGTVIQLLATPATDDSYFQQWEDCANGTDSTTTVTLDVAKTCTATFIKVTPPLTGGIIKTIAGNGLEGYDGNNKPAKEARLRKPYDMVMDSAGNLYIADTFNSVIRKVTNIHDPDPKNHIINTLAGDGTLGYSGDGSNATAAQLHWPYSVAIDSQDNLYIADTMNNLIRKVDIHGKITTKAGVTALAGKTAGGYSGDGGPAIAAMFKQPHGLAFDKQGNLYIADYLNHVVRKIKDSDQTIITVAGSGISGYTGDGGAATMARLNLPTGIALDSAGNLYIADSENHVVRKVGTDGIITSLEPTLGLAVVDVAVDAKDNLYLVDQGTHLLRELDTSGKLTTIAGTGTAGFNGDEIPSATAQLSSPTAVSVDTAGNVILADGANYRIRQIAINTILHLQKIGSGTVELSSGLKCDPTCQELEEYYPTNTKVSLTATPAESFTFVGWEGDGKGIANPKTVLLNVPKQCTAHFEPLFELTMTKPGAGNGSVTSDIDGIDCGSTCKAAFTRGESVTLTQEPATDSLFVSWGGDCGKETTPTATVTLTKALSCVANFALKPKLTVKVIGSGLVTDAGENIACPSGCEALYNQGDSVTLTAEAEPDSRFLSWSEGCIGTSSTTTVKLDTTAKTCVATFSLTPKLTVSKVGTGTITSASGDINCGSDCLNNYATDTAVILTATPDANSRFTSWGGDCAGLPNPGSVFVNTAKSCVANFEIKPGLTVQSNGNGTVVSNPAGISCQPTCEMFLENGTSASLTATPAADSVFSGWEGNCTGTTPTVAVTIAGITRCTAKFELINAHDMFTVTPTGITQVAVNINQTFLVHWDRAGKPQAGEIINLATTFGVLSAPTIQLDAKGNGKFTVRADAPGTATLTVSTAMVVGGHTQSFTFNFIVTDDVLSIAPADLAFVLINTDQTLTVHWEKAGVPQVNQPLNLAATVGTVSAATVLTNDKGDATFTTRSPVAGDTLVTVSIANGLSAQIGFTFVDNFSSIQLATPHYTVNEADSKAILLLTRAGSLRGVVTVDYQTVDGTAVANTDYTPASGMVTWADGDMLQKVVEIPLLATLQLADPKTFTVVLSKVTGFAVLGTTAQASVTIINAPGSGAGSLQFTTGEFTAKESDGLATISVERIGGNKNAVSVSYTTRDGTAIAGQDYTLMQGSLNWVAGDAQPKTFAVPILSDEEVESVETLSLNLNNPTGGANLGARALATLRIIDSLGTPTTPMTDLPGVVQFEADNYQIVENAGNITLTVTRTQGSRGVVTVHYSTQEDTATNADFIGTAGDLRWLDGEANSQMIKIGLFDNASIDSTRKFIVKLTNLVGGDKLGDNAKTIVSIEDDDATSLHFSKADYVVNEDIPKATLTVVREGGNVGTVSVDYATMGDCSTKSCATAGQDYTAVTGTLTWVSGDTTDKTFTVPLLDDRDIEGTESIALSLTNATGNASLGTLSEATLTLLDNDATDCKPAAVIDCYLRNQGTLRDIKITQYGTVEGGKVGGQVTTDGVLKDVTFLAKARVTGGVFGGIVRGVIESDPVDPAILNNVSISKVGTEDTILKNIIVGRGSTVDSDILFQEGVRFEDNSLIPSVADLAEILGKIHTPELSLDAINLTNDVLLNSAVDGILGAINGLYDLASEGFVLTQNSQNGYLQLDIERFHYAVLPVQVTQILRKQATELISMGMSVYPDGAVDFITHTGRNVRTLPVAQAPLALKEALKSLGYQTFTMLANGNLRVPASGDDYFSARPSLFATDLDTNLPLGLSSTDCEWLLGLPAVYLIYDVEGQLRQQFFYPAAADPDALYVLAGESQTVLENGGRAFVHTGNGIDKHSYRGYFDYLVKPGAEPSGRRARVDVTDDVNQDGLPDYLVTYPNGDRQILFQLP